MSGRHTYGSDTRNRLKTLCWLALFAFMLSGAFTILHKKIAILPLDWLPDTLSISAAFFLVYWVYDKFIWKISSRVPDISGTWVGVVLPNYQREWPHLEILTVDQTWSEISLHGAVYFRNCKTDPWSLESKQGTYRSVAAGMTDLETKKSEISLCYEHRGSRVDQPDFQGSMCLEYNSTNDRLEGKYYTNRIDRTKNIEGSLGRVLLRRVSKKILSPEEAFSRGDLLVHLERELLMGSRSPGEASGDNAAT
jgi:hypothetical protein